MEKINKPNYEDFIVSTLDELTFLHRCFRSGIEGIMQTGLRSGINLQSTATLQPRDLQIAKGLYLAGKDHGDSAVVIKIPRQIWEGVRREDPEYNGCEVMHQDIGYTLDGDFYVKPEFTKAWIDRNTNEVHLK